MTLLQSITWATSLPAEVVYGGVVILGLASAALIFRCLWAFSELLDAISDYLRVKSKY